MHLCFGISRSSCLVLIQLYLYEKLTGFACNNRVQKLLSSDDFDGMAFVAFQTRCSRISLLGHNVTGFSM